MANFGAIFKTLANAAKKINWKGIAESAPVVLGAIGTIRGAVGENSQRSAKIVPSAGKDPQNAELSRFQNRLSELEQDVISQSKALMELTQVATATDKQVARLEQSVKSLAEGIQQLVQTNTILSSRLVIVFVVSGFSLLSALIALILVLTKLH